MKRKRFFILIEILSLFLTGCASGTERQNDVMQETSAQDGAQETAQAEAAVQNETEETVEPEAALQNETEENTESETAAQAENTEILTFVDVFGQEYQVEINPGIEKHNYRNECFVHNGDILSYVGDENYEYRLGIDVSSFQGQIDWERVRSAGFEFAFIRLGYRGYGAEGVLCLDREFERNIQNAQAAGMEVGVYFFAQAVNEEEAQEEAEFVLQYLDGYELQLPVVYDPESILNDTARTDHVSGEQFTKNTEVFCNAIEEAGYQSMIYCNMLWEAFELDLLQLTDYPIWYADYEPFPQTPYRFEFWQYTNTGTVDGISGEVDIDIWLMECREDA